MAHEGDPWAGFQSEIDAMGKGGPVAPNTGPTPGNALSGNFVAGGKLPMVYWGSTPVPTHRSDAAQDAADQLGITPGGNHELTLQAAIQDWYSWSDKERAEFTKRAYALGLVSDPNDILSPQGGFGVWQNAVQQASNFYTAAGRKVTPWQAVDLLANNARGGQPKSETESRVHIPTVEDAHALTRGLFQDLLGRDPDDEELNRYASRVTAYAKKHPEVATSTATRDAKGNISRSVQSSGGFTEAGVRDALGQQAKKDPEYGAYQAATTYFNAVIQAIGGTGG